MLQRAWAKAREGHGQSVHIVGEAGIGKSRLVSELRRHITQGDGEEHLIQCHHRLSNRPLHPFFNFLEALVGKEALSERNSATLGTELASQGIPVDAEAARILAAFAAAKSPRTTGHLQTSDISGARYRDQVIGAAVELLSALASGRARLIVFEDVHWADSMTGELIERLSASAPALPILVLATRRSAPADEAASGTGEPRVATATTTITLAGLTGPAMADLVSFVWQSRAPAGLAEFIREKSDGVPLFGEELADFLQRRAGSGSTAADWRALLNESGIASLNDLLSARLADAGAARRMAQVASVIGREFSVGVMERVLDPGPDAAALEADLAELVGRGILEARAADGETALPLPPCPAAGGGLCQPAQGRPPAHPPAHRPPPRGGRVARHAERARGLALRAGRLPARRRPLRDRAPPRPASCARPCPRPTSCSPRRRSSSPAPAPDRQRDRASPRRAAAARRGVGGAVGRGIPGDPPHLRTGVSICRRQTGGDPADRFAISWGWWFTAPTITVQQARAGTLIDDLEKVHDPEVRLQSYHCAWATNFHAGQHQFCLDCVAEGLALYDAERARRNRAIYGGHDARVCGLGERALSLALMADDAGSRGAIADCLAWAEAIDHVGSLVHALYYAVISGAARAGCEEVLDARRTDARRGGGARHGRLPGAGGHVRRLGRGADRRRSRPACAASRPASTCSSGSGPKTPCRSISTCRPRSSNAPGAPPTRSG